MGDKKIGVAKLKMQLIEIRERKKLGIGCSIWGLKAKETKGGIRKEE
jgi:hypothetical protein